MTRDMTLPVARRPRDAVLLLQPAERVSRVSRVAAVLDRRIALQRAWVGWAAVGYLLAPVVLFLVVYLHSAATIIAGVVLAGVLFWMGRRSRRVALTGGSAAVSVRGLIAFAVAAVAVALSSGAVGGFRLMMDWFKHDSMLFDLSTNPWPVSYSYLGHASLVYNFAFYLPAAAISKIFAGSVPVAHIALVLWMAVGYFCVLVCAAVLLPARLRVVGAIAAMLTYAGAESLGTWIITNHDITTPNAWWAGSVQYSSAWTQIRWVPQHAIPGWILGALYLLAWRERSWVSVRRLAIACFAAALWSPFAFIGGAILTIAAAARLLLGKSVPSLDVIVTTVVAAIGCAPAIAFLGLSAGGQQFESGALPPWLYALFVGLMIGLWAIAGLVASPMRLALVVPIVLLVLLPAFHLGTYNDLVMRVSIPSLFVITLVAWDGALRSRRKGLRRLVGIGALGAAVLLGLPSGMTELSYSVNASVGAPGTMNEPRVLDQPLPDYLATTGQGPGTAIWAQYINCSDRRLAAVLGLAHCRA